jgi:carbonic anhydrase/acetyltransferase-like protein (isoleucine patch superfamily)
MSGRAYPALFDGTRMNYLPRRALGVRIGHKVFDDGCAIPEKSLVNIGDRTSLNAGSTIRARSLEDGMFESGHIAVLDAGSFLKKGEDLPERTRYRGNPAREARVS